MIREIKIDGEKYSCCRDICNHISLSKGQRQNEMKRLRTDKNLQCNVIKAFADTNGGKQKCIFIKNSMIHIWLYKINASLLHKEQIIKMNELLCKFENDEIEINNIESNYYVYESELRDEIYNIGWFNNIKILEKEKIYEFGRIDLYGISSNNEKVCIELKKGNCFSNTKEQLLKYKESNYFDKIIYCALSIDNNLLSWLKDNGIIPYVYKRQLVLSEVC